MQAQDCCPPWSGASSPSTSHPCTSASTRSPSSTLPVAPPPLVPLTLKLRPSRALSIPSVALRGESLCQSLLGHPGRDPALTRRAGAPSRPVTRCRLQAMSSIFLLFPWVLVLFLGMLSLWKSLYSFPSVLKKVFVFHIMKALCSVLALLRSPCGGNAISLFPGMSSVPANIAANVY